MFWKILSVPQNTAMDLNDDMDVNMQPVGFKITRILTDYAQKLPKNCTKQPIELLVVKIELLNKTLLHYVTPNSNKH